MIRSSVGATIYRCRRRQVAPNGAQPFLRLVSINRLLLTELRSCGFGADAWRVAGRWDAVWRSLQKPAREQGRFCQDQT
jgi:hypothetical protein